MRKALIAMALGLMTGSCAVGQKAETVELPFSFCNQTKWQAVETTIQLSGEQEEVLAYQLHNWGSISNEQRSGDVYYVPQALEDRVMLVMKGVNIRETHPNIIDNQTDKTLILCIEEKATLSCPGSVIRSKGSVQIFGEGKDDGEAATTTLTINQYKAGGRASIEAQGDVYLQELNVDIKNATSFAIRTVPGKDGAVLTLNNVTGKLSGKQAATSGFTAIEGRASDVEGVEITNIEGETGDEEATEETTAEEEEATDEIKTSTTVADTPLLGGDLYLPFSVLGWNRWAQLPPEQVDLGNGKEMWGIPLNSHEVISGKIYYVPSTDELLFANVNLSSKDMDAVAKTHDGGHRMTIRFIGKNTIEAKGSVFEAQGSMMLAAAGDGASLTVSTGENFINMKDNGELILDGMDINITDGADGLTANIDKDVRLFIQSTALKTNVSGASIEGFRSIDCIDCGPMYGYWQAPLSYDRKVRTFNLGGKICNNLEIERFDAYLDLHVNAQTGWDASDAQRVNKALEAEKNSKRTAIKRKVTSKVKR